MLYVMAGIDLQGLESAIFARLTTDLLGTPVRAVLGSGVASILHADQLSAYTDANPMPARPLLALRGGAMPGTSYDIRIPLWSWWIYDDRDQRYFRINGLIPLIERAYPSDSIGNGIIGFGRIAVSHITEEAVDAALGLATRRLQFAFYTRG